MPITIRKAETPEDRLRVFRFRYEIYVEEMGRAQTYADHEARTIEEPFDRTGHIFLAEEDGVVVGTVRTNFGQDTDFGAYREFYGMDALSRVAPQYISVTTKFMVAPDYRLSALGYRLGAEKYQYNLSHGILFDFIDCNPHLENIFERLGYRRYRSRIDHPEYGDVLPLILPLADLEHLETVGSPWAKICREHYPHLHANRLLHQVIHKYQTEPQTNVA